MRGQIGLQGVWNVDYYWFGVSYCKFGFPKKQDCYSSFSSVFMDIIWV